jgi:hypothetical protein
MKFSDVELANCARRELAQRRRVYRRLLSNQRMDQKTANTEIAMMEQIAEYFENKTQPKLL